MARAEPGNLEATFFLRRFRNGRFTNIPLPLSRQAALSSRSDSYRDGEESPGNTGRQTS